LPLHTKHRPATLDEIVGNESVIASLQSVLTREKDRPHVYLFTGDAGTGKTTLAFIIKDILNCSESDFYYYNTANTRGVQTIRAIIDNCQFAPMNGDIKFFVMEEAHGITKDALDALLKFLEFVPEHVYFAFCTSEPERWHPKKRAALKRRCHTSEMKPLLLPEILKLLESILEKEGVKEFPDDVLVKIADVCNGSPGMALNLLDTVIDIADNETAFLAIESATVSEANIAQIAQVLIAGNGQWKDVATLVKGLSGEPESLRYAFLNYFNKVLLGRGKDTDRIAEILNIFCEPIMYSSHGGLTTEIYLAWKASIPTSAF